MKGFSIYVKNDLLEPKHIQNMDAAVWLYLWLLDKMTSVNENGIGKVLGNTPITYTMIYEELGITERTYQRWVAKLRANGYINTLRTPHGLCFSVTKASKQFKKSSAKKVVSQNEVIRQIRYSDPPNVVERSAKMVDVNKDNTKTKQDNTNIYVKSATPTTRISENKLLFNKLVLELGFSDQVKATPGRMTKLKLRLKAYAGEDLIKAATNIGNDPFMQGDNQAGKRYGTIDYLLRTDEKVDEWLHTRGNKLNNERADW